MAGSQPVWVLSADLFVEVINVFTIPHAASAVLELPCPLGALVSHGTPRIVVKNISFAALGFLQS